jgi:elongator complex protein 3
MNHPTDKIELIVLGGTFLQYDLEYQYEFIKKCFDSLNGKGSKNLEEAKRINEKAEHRCIAMCIENRPDNCSEEEIQRMLDFGCTRVEIGVQMPDDYLYEKSNRGHTVQDVVDATKRLKDAGFKVGYHIMPGLPYSNIKNDLELFKKVFSDSKFRPDQLKIYPCQVVENSPLAKTHEIIKFKPYSEKETKDLLEKMMKLIPEYCRVMRMMREFPKEKLIDGVERLDLRKDIEEDFRKSGEKINEIRMREVGFNKKVDLDVNLKVLEYESSEGKEFFLEIVNKDNILFGLLRLRIFEGKAIVRELHVYGQAIKLGEIEEMGSQHKGIGKLLLEKAEEITKENNVKKLSIISGIGVREYYKNLGYDLEGNYMVKNL